MKIMGIKGQIFFFGQPCIFSLVPLSAATDAIQCEL